MTHLNRVIDLKSVKNAKWRTLPPTEKQKEILAQYAVKCPTTRGAASDLIARNAGKPRFKCGKCDKPAKVTMQDGVAVVKCCGVTERYYDRSKPKPNSEIRVARDNFNPYKGSGKFATGEMVFHYGSLEYLDDGNGNVYDRDEELRELDED